MKRTYLLLVALTVFANLGAEAHAQRPGITRMSPSPASLGRDRFINTTPPVVMGTPLPFFAGAGHPTGSALPFNSPFFGSAFPFNSPFFSAPVNPFAFNTGFGFGGYGGYPYPMSNYGSNSSYGSGAGYAAAAEYLSRPQTSSSEDAPRSADIILGSSGVPTQNGKVSWPLGLRLLRADDLLKQLEGQLQLAAAQAVAGGVNPRLADEIRDNVETIRQALAADKEWRFSMPLTTYQDSEVFLRKLAKAPTLLQASAPAGRESEKRQLQTAPSQKKEGSDPYPKPD
jgi:hypothetical protein